jgi:hypothetical protein
MKRSSGPRKTANLSGSIQRQLNMYALAASAAGVSLMTLAQPAEAKIVYTPANVNIPQNGGLIGFDLNHDGIDDFALREYQGTFISQSIKYTYALLQVSPKKQANEVWVQNRGGPQACASALPKGTKIGFLKGRFGAGNRFMAEGGNLATGCPWAPANTAYLGLKFVIKGKVHFGWMRVSAATSHPGTAVSISATVLGYAYETIPGKAIIAGATKGPDDPEPTASVDTPTPVPATLDAFALGAPGLSIWRRKESALQGN